MNNVTHKKIDYLEKYETPSWHFDQKNKNKTLLTIFFLSFLRERKNKSQGREQRENPKQAPCWMQSPAWDSVSQPWDHGLSQNEESEARLSHLGTLPQNS